MLCPKYSGSQLEQQFQWAYYYDYYENFSTIPRRSIKKSLHRSKNRKYPNNILDRDGKEKDQYLQEPEVMKFFKDNDNKITSTTEGPSGVQTKTFTNKFLNKSAVNAPKGVFPKG